MRDEMIAGMAVDSPVPTSGQDALLYRLVVSSFGLTILLCVLGALVLSFVGKPVPDVVSVLGGGAVGALGALLAPSPVK